MPIRPLIFAAFALTGALHAELPIPPPAVHRLVPPALTAPKNVAIEGLGFNPLPDSPFEVHVGPNVVPARRESPTRIVVDASALAPLFRDLGHARDRRYPVWIKVGGEKSNRVQLAIVNSAHGGLHGRVAVAKNRLVPGGKVKVRIPERNLETAVHADGTFAFRDLPPLPTRLVLEWPGVVKDMEQTATVPPGDAASVAPFKIEVPPPTVSEVKPSTIKEPEPLLVSGAHFLSEAAAPFEVLIDGKPVAAIRAREDAIQIPSRGLVPYFAAVSAKTGRKTSKLVVKVAGVATKPVELTFVRLKAPPARAVAKADEEPDDE